jgi:hypothetical protein
MVRSGDCAPATRGDVRRSEENIRREMKDEIFSVRRDLSLVIVRLQSDVSGIRGIMATLATKEDINRLFVLMDGFGVSGKSVSVNSAFTGDRSAPPISASPPAPRA